MVEFILFKDEIALPRTAAAGGGALFLPPAAAAQSGLQQQREEGERRLRKVLATGSPGRERDAQPWLMSNHQVDTAECRLQKRCAE